MEYFDVVDENDEIIGKAERAEVHRKGLWHRGVHIVVINSEGKLLLQKRSMNKDLYKGFWIDGAAGHVESGENYKHCAKRELKEELGITANLTRLFDFKKRTGLDNEFIHVFGCRHDGPFNVEKDEADFVRFFTLDEINKLLKKDREIFTPATLNIIEEFNRRPELLKRLLRVDS